MFAQKGSSPMYTRKIILISTVNDISSSRNITFVEYIFKDV